MKQLNILIRCDASVEIGLGHITRCLVLANDFKDKGHIVYFAIKNFELGINKVTEQGFQYFLPPTPLNYHQWITDLSEQLNINVFVGDVRDGLAIKTIEQLKANNILTVAIDEPSDYRKACDLCFYPPHSRLDKFDWSGFSGEIRQGIEYVLLRPEFYKLYKKTNNKIPRIMVMIGGTDPQRLTLKVTQIILASINKQQIHVVISKRHPDYQQLNSLSSVINLHSNINNMADFLLNIDTAVISFGTIAYELIAMQCPATYICLNEDDWFSSEPLEQQKWAKRLMLNDLHCITPFLQVGSFTDNAIMKNMIADIIYEKVGYGS